MRTEVRDRRTGATFTQLCVGRMSDRTMPCPWPRSERTIGDRIVFTHSPILHHKTDVSLQNELPARPTMSGVSGWDSGSSSSFAMVTVLSEPLEANISASLVSTPSAQAKDPSRLETKRGVVDGTQDRSARGSVDESQEDGQQSEAGPAIILGPVVGRVEVVAQSGIVRESCCVPVVIEVDREGRVACVVSFEKHSTSLGFEMVFGRGISVGVHDIFMISRG